VGADLLVCLYYSLHGRSAGWLGWRGLAAYSVGAFPIVIMTYYGVNYYLSGLHSYGAGLHGHSVAGVCLSRIGRVIPVLGIEPTARGDAAATQKGSTTVLNACRPRRYLSVTQSQSAGEFLSVLERVNEPADLRQLSVDELEHLCQELRTELWTPLLRWRTPGGVAGRGGIDGRPALCLQHAEGQAGVDVGHQGYIHKILTGRRSRLSTIRQYQGLSGFLKRNESEYDTFGAGHASTSLSAAYGMAVARDMQGDDYNVVAIIGDGGMTADSHSRR